MDDLLTTHINCPCCGENIELVINTEDAGDSYIEDCSVCCSPITLSVKLDEQGEVQITACDESAT